MRKWLFATLLSLPLVSAANIGANLLYYQSRFAELEVRMEDEVRDLSKAETTDLLYLCSAYFHLKRYNKLFPCLDQMERNAAKGDVGGFMVGGDISWFLHIYRADASLELGDYANAVRHARTAYDYVLRRGMREQSKIYPLASLALAYALNGEREQALAHAQLLDAVGDFLGANLSPRLVGLAKVYLALGDFQKCIATLRQEAGRRGLLGTITYTIGIGIGAVVFHELPKHFITSKCLLEAGERAQAKAGYEALLAHPQTASIGGLYWLVLCDLGRIAEAEGRSDQAIDYYRRAIEVIERQRSTINTETSKIGFAGDKQDIYRALVAQLFARDRHAEAFDFVERSKARALVDQLAGKTDFAVSEGDAEAVRKLVASAQTAEIESLAYEALPGQRTRSSSIAENARRQLEQQSPELASLVAVNPTPLAEIQSRIPDDEAIIEFYDDARAVYAFVLTRTALRARRLEAGGMEADVRALRHAIGEPATDRYAAPSRALYARLIAPLEELIAGRKLLIVPHGALHYLPFAALHDGRQFLLDRHALRFLPSASVIRYLRTHPQAVRAGVLAFGNPDLGDPGLDLKFAQDEALAIAQKMPHSRALVRKEASETAFHRFAAGFSALHFATHGEFNSDAPLRSALMLAKDADSEGRLTVGKLYATRIAADLVTLSACETGLGKVANGDDVVGLTRGFLYAGASTVVASLWKVDDRATSALMMRFYDELKAGDKREALRRAQLATREQFPHPFFWAAFQLTGLAD